MKKNKENKIVCKSMDLDGDNLNQNFISENFLDENNLCEYFSDKNSENYLLNELNKHYLVSNELKMNKNGNLITSLYDKNEKIQNKCIGTKKAKVQTLKQKKNNNNKMLLKPKNSVLAEESLNTPRIKANKQIGPPLLKSNISKICHFFIL